MKKLFVTTLAVLSLGVYAQWDDNYYNDDIDKNAIPAELEEERVGGEKVESDMVQNDDPEREWDPADRERDEQQYREQQEANGSLNEETDIGTQW